MKFQAIFLCGFIFLQIIPSSLLLPPHFPTSGIRGFGEICGCGDYCDQTLECIESKCTCPQGLTYFPLNQKCYLKVGQNCSSHENSCVKNAKCNQAKICECNPQSNQLPNGACSGHYGEKCNANQPCTKEEFLDCKDETCVCSENTTLERDKTCVTPIDSKCSSNGDPKFPTDKCPKNSQCIEDRCRCDAGFKKGNRICWAEFGTPCEGNDCADKLECKNGFCSCRLQTQIWNGSECRYKLGEICFDHTGNNKCEDENATCLGSDSQYTDTSQYRCECNGCFRPMNGTCVPPN